MLQSLEVVNLSCGYSPLRSYFVADLSSFINDDSAPVVPNAYPAQVEGIFDLLLNLEPNSN